MASAGKYVIATCLFLLGCEHAPPSVEIVHASLRTDGTAGAVYVETDAGDLRVTLNSVVLLDRTVEAGRIPVGFSLPRGYGHPPGPTGDVFRAELRSGGRTHTDTITQTDRIQ